MPTKVVKIGEDTIHIHCPCGKFINAVTIDDKGEPHVESYLKEPANEPTPKPAAEPEPEPARKAKSSLFGL